MTVGEIINSLITAENYAEIRMTIDDNFILFIKDMMPGDYELLKQKEERYQALVKLLNKIGNDEEQSVCH
jgi:hypothetical protein